MFSFQKKYQKKANSFSSDFSLILGKNEKDEIVSIPEKGLYQNILITGTIGTGKTSSAMYPFTKQLIEYRSFLKDDKLGMLILDVKGNYYTQVIEYASHCGREQDVIVLDLSGKQTYNPLHKPDLKASILANRLKTILLLFSPHQTEDFWLDKVEEVLTECIKLCRLYNNSYVTFEELHNLIMMPNYYQSKIELLRYRFLQNELSPEDCYHLLTALRFFEKEYFSFDERTLGILKGEITRITNLFLSDYSVKNIFCSPLHHLTFTGFDEVISQGKIVVLHMNIAEYQNLSKTIAAYLKLDFQTAVMKRLQTQSQINRSVCFISDEYAEYVTSSDASFFAQSREAKCINIVATQSYTSLLHTLHDSAAVKVIVQNLVNKLWFRSDDLFTIEDAQKQIGKEEKEKISQTISENAKETNFSYILNRFHSYGSNLSESYNTYLQFDYKFDTRFFTQELETFSCLSFLSDGSRILPPQKIQLFKSF